MLARGFALRPTVVNRWDFVAVPLIFGVLVLTVYGLRGMDVPLMHGWFEEQDLAYLLAFSEDRDEGVTAFAEKREPKFKGQ